MKYVIWGAGEKGARIFQHLCAEEVTAFIDINEEKVGKEYCGKKIISYEEYKKHYRECYIIISYSHESEVVERLKADYIDKYFLLSDCPGEFQESYPRELLKKYIVNYVKRDRRYIIYGCTLYSFILRDWLRKELGIVLDIVPHRDVSPLLIEQLKMQIPEIHFYNMDELQYEKVDEILVTVEQDINIIQQKYKNTVVTNVYDCSDRIEEYYNPQIEKFRNIHKGERCFIIATGPSLRMEDLEVLAAHQEICIGVNSIWKAFPNTAWRPQYYIAMDYRALRDWGDIMENADISYLFWGDTYKEYWMREHAEKHIKHHCVFEYNEKRLPKFSEDFARKSYMGSTITYNAIQLATYMGFKEIYLLGVDFSYAGENGAKYCHFFKEKELTSVGFEKQVFLAYCAAKQYADTHDIKIYNATRGGKLEVFERVNFDDLFEEKRK